MKPRALVMLVTVIAGSMSGVAAEARRPPAVAEKNEPKIVATVLGQVAKPGAFELPRGSTLLDALAAAGGWLRTGDLARVTVLRGPADEKPQVRSYNVRAILQGEAANPKIEGGDTIHVDERIL